MIFKKEKIKTDEKLINELLERGVSEIIQKGSLKKKLLSGKQLRVKLGIDPTSPNIHLGRSITLLKLRDFQKLGHKIIFIIGDATGVIGDTSDKESERPMLTKEEVKNNSKTYFKQVGKLLDISKVETHYNSEWLNKLSFQKLGELADKFSISDFIARNLIKKRLDSGKRVSLREMLYPLMQGYDSVVIKADVELGGTDQKFNLLAGRTLQEKEKQDILMIDLILGTDGRKMSSSWGNTIDIVDEPNEMYGKIMSIGDDLVFQYFISATRVSIEEIKRIKTLHPKKSKMRLAKEIVSLHYDEKIAEKAEQNFINTFKPTGFSENAVVIDPKGKELIDINFGKDIIKSKNELRRLIVSGSISSTISGKKITDPHHKFDVDDNIKIGKRRFVKIKVKK